MKKEKILFEKIDDMENWRIRLVKLMRQKELSVIAASKLIGINRITLQHFLEGDKMPDFVRVSKILNWIEKEEKQLG